MSVQPETRDIVITRVFNAPIEQVWSAWHEPDLVKQWWGPTGFTCPVANMDFREGGTSLVCMRAPADFGGQDYYNTWTYHKIVPLERMEYIVSLSEAEGNKVDPTTQGLPPDMPQDVRHLVTFRRVSDNQTEITVTEYDWTVGQMMEMSKMGQEQCLDKMAALWQ